MRNFTMNNEIYNYIANKVINDVRHGIFFNDKLADSLDGYPLITYIREKTEESDIPRLLNVINNASLSAGNLALSMLRKFDNKKDIKEYYLSCWKEEKVFIRKFKLIWRLLDDEQLPISLHEEIYQFIRENFDEFLKEISKWYGGKNNVLSSIKERLKDSSFPSTKDWVRLCSVMASPEHNQVVELLKEYQSSDNKFTAFIAQEMLAEVKHDLPQN